MDPTSLKLGADMESNGSSKTHATAKDTRSDSDASGNGYTKSKESSPTATTTPATASDITKSPRKRRKVNHGMLCSVAVVLVPLVLL